MDSPLVSVIIISWNRKKDVLETIQSIYDQAYQHLEIIVVDNGSTDGTADALHQAYPFVKVIVLDRNMGIAGRNSGIAVARGDIIFCLDSDASPGHNTLTNIVSRFQADPEVGVINSKIVNAYTRKIDRIAGWSYSDKVRRNQDQEFLSYSFSEGGCAIRKEVFDKVGLFWERLFFGCEGLELSMRVWDAGYKILYYPEAIVYHRVSSDMRIVGAERECLVFRNTLYIYLVRCPIWLLVILAPLKIAATFVRSVRHSYLLRVLYCLIVVLREIPVLWKERCPIRNNTAWLYLRLQREHGILSWDLFSWLKFKT